ncbi:hypothetical protein TRFO_22441 [Tritrichomonas foetus]|uniref:Uncharacterized protein n=1 Tax=Tritrichomonas foetus TaxID=1144522 RepID=A0A1J4KBS7_9EUKA|nr:hypothetical protein TRFO_22441 [Tritrichomonas foetus]|eukprot:OHT08865.1 hypothetical protein TRFO_22441 [Tritrichomonas foetus]
MSIFLSVSSSTVFFSDFNVPISLEICVRFLVFFKASIAFISIFESELPIGKSDKFTNDEPSELVTSELILELPLEDDFLEPFLSEPLFESFDELLTEFFDDCFFGCLVAFLTVFVVSRVKEPNDSSFNGISERFDDS